MSNECINQLILSGERRQIFNLVTNAELYYKKNEIFELNDNTFCVVFSSEWFPPEEFLCKISKEYPTIHLHNFYAVKLSGIRGCVYYHDGNRYATIEHNSFSLSEMHNELSSMNFYTEKGLLTCSK